VSIAAQALAQAQPKAQAQPPGQGRRSKPGTAPARAYKPGRHHAAAAAERSELRGIPQQLAALAQKKDRAALTPFRGGSFFLGSRGH